MKFIKLGGDVETYILLTDDHSCALALIFPNHNENEREKIGEANKCQKFIKVGDMKLPVIPPPIAMETTKKPNLLRTMSRRKWRLMRSVWNIYVVTTHGGSVRSASYAASLRALFPNCRVHSLPNGSNATRPTRPMCDEAEIHDLTKRLYLGTAVNNFTAGPLVVQIFKERNVLISLFPELGNFNILFTADSRFADNSVLTPASAEAPERIHHLSYGSFVHMIR